MIFLNHYQSALYCLYCGHPVKLKDGNRGLNQTEDRSHIVVYSCRNHLPIEVEYYVCVFKNTFELYQVNLYWYRENKKFNLSCTLSGDIIPEGTALYVFKRSKYEWEHIIDIAREWLELLPDKAILRVERLLPLI